jgi:hypothetical protein
MIPLFREVVCAVEHGNSCFFTVSENRDPDQTEKAQIDGA